MLEVWAFTKETNEMMQYAKELICINIYKNTLLFILLEILINYKRTLNQIKFTITK